MPPSCLHTPVGGLIGNRRGSSAHIMHSSPGYAALQGGSGLTGGSNIGLSLPAEGPAIALVLAGVEEVASAGAGAVGVLAVTRGGIPLGGCQRLSARYDMKTYRSHKVSCGSYIIRKATVTSASPPHRMGVGFPAVCCSISLREQKRSNPHNTSPELIRLASAISLVTFYPACEWVCYSP